MTQKIVTFLDDNEVMTGKEKYPVIGKAISNNQAKKIILKCKGLKLYWDCIDKAKRAQEILKRGKVVFGSCTIWSGDWQSNYQFLFNPPYELHSWLELENGQIIDIGLAGAILKGSILRDDIGPFLVNRKPKILAGYPPKWIEYKVYEYLKGN